MKTILLSSVFLLIAGCATSNNVVANKSGHLKVAEAEVKVDKPKRKCIAQKSIGSHMKKKTCWASEEEYRRDRERMKEEMKRRLDVLNDSGIRHDQQ